MLDYFRSLTYRLRRKHEKAIMYTSNSFLLRRSAEGLISTWENILSAPLIDVLDLGVFCTRFMSVCKVLMRKYQLSGGIVFKKKLTFEYIPLYEFLSGGPHGQAAYEAGADGLPRLLPLVLALYHQNIPVGTTHTLIITHITQFTQCSFVRTDVTFSRRLTEH